MKKRIIIWGLGTYYHIYRDFLEREYEIVACVDSDSTKASLVDNFCYPEDILQNNADCIVVSTRKYEAEIKKFLLMDIGIADFVCIGIDSISKEVEAMSFKEKKEVFSKTRLSTETVFVIGDSHSIFFGGTVRKLDDYQDEYINYVEPIIFPFFPIHLGPVLAYSLNKYGASSLGREKIDYLLNTGFIPKGAKVCLSFGEIDIRVHVIKQSIEQNRSIEQIIDEIVESYMSLIRCLKKYYTIFVWGPIAQQSDYTELSESYPRCGSQMERNEATRYFNSRMIQECKKSNVAFVSIFEKLIDNKLQTNGLYYCDGVHLHSNAWKLAKTEWEQWGIFANV